MDRRSVMLGGLVSGMMLPRSLAAQVAVKAGDPRVAALVEQVSIDRLRADVTALAGFGTRWTPSPTFPAVEAWVEAAFVAAGAAPGSASRVPFALADGSPRHSILSGDPADPRGIVLVGAHFDSISEDPARLAPGANDNATGVAAMLEAHRLLGPVALGRGLVCVAFAGEEQEMLGSTAVAERAAREGWRIDLMLNLDMLGHHPADPGAPLIIEVDQGNAQPGNDAAARRLGRIAARLAAAHTTLTVRHTDIWDSDYMAFEAQGFPCIGLYDDGVDSAQYHSSRDVPESVDFDRLVQATRLVVAVLATVAGLPG